MAVETAIHKNKKKPRFTVLGHSLGGHRRVDRGHHAAKHTHVALRRVRGARRARPDARERVRRFSRPCVLHDDGDRARRWRTCRTCARVCRPSTGARASRRTRPGCRRQASRGRRRGQDGRGDGELAEAHGGGGEEGRRVRGGGGGETLQQGRRGRRRQGRQGGGSGGRRRLRSGQRRRGGCGSLASRFGASLGLGGASSSGAAAAADDASPLLCSSRGACSTCGATWRARARPRRSSAGT